MTVAAAVIEKNNHALAYYGLEDGRLIERVTLAPFPHEMARSRDGRYAYCAHFGVALAEDEGPGGNSVSVVDLQARRLVQSLDCTDRRRPHGIAVDGAGRLYVASEATSRLLIWADPLDGAVVQDQPTGGEGSHTLSVTSDGRWVFSSNMRSNDVTILDTSDPGRPPSALPTGRRPEGSVLDAEERRLFVVNRESASITVVDVAAKKLSEEIATPPGPVRIALDKHGKLLVPLYHARALARLDPDRPAERRLLDLPGKPVSIGYDPARGLALISVLGDELCIVDLDSWSIMRRIPTGPGPDPAVVVDCC